MSVVFSGENPGLVLFRPGTDEVVAAASYWRCVYSEHGEGNALIIWTDKDASGLGGNAPHAIYTDNPGVARLVTDRFTQHFDRFKDLGFGTMETRHARFFQDSDSRWYHRVVCNTGYAVIELTWWDVLDYQMVKRDDWQLGESNFDLATVICPCGSASIEVANVPVEGEVHTSTDDTGKQSSSAFLAFSETWVDRS